MCIKFTHKVYVFLLLFMLFNICKLTAQDSILYAKYSFSFKNKLLLEILLDIKHQTNLGLSYNPDYIPLEKTFSAEFIQVPLNKIIDSVLSDFNLKYRLIGTTLAISKAVIKDSNPEHKSTSFYSDTLQLLKFAGTVEDDKNHDRIPYASVFIKGHPIGTITNSDGNFFITIPENFQSDTLSVSNIGYQLFSIPVSELKTGVVNLFSLKTKTVDLPEIVVRYVDVNELLKNVTKNIPFNYCIKPQQLEAFYRETLERNGKYVLLSEAVLKIYKASYSGLQNDQVSIFKGRKNQLQEKMDTIKLKLQGGIYNCLQLDLAKNQSNFMAGENIDFYEYKYEGICDIQEHSAYVISFDQKEDVPFSLYKGKLYIEINSNALIRAEFRLSPRGMDYAAQYLVQKAPRGVNVKPVFANYLVNYTERNNKWLLGNIREEIGFKIHKRYRFFSTDFKTIAEMVITNIDTVNVERFKHNEIIRSSDIFVEKIDSYDPKFWDNFNYIAPDKTLQDAIDEIVEKLERAK
jgi:hypothetical protein